MGGITLTVHTILAVFYGYSTYVYMYGVYPPKEIMIHRETNYGVFKYLTFWNLLLQLLFFTLCTLNDVISLKGGRRRGGPSLLQRLLDFLFATIIFSASTFVATSFWTLYSIDRELIFPAIFDTFFPSWLNHAVHSVPLAAVLMEMLAINHAFPTQRKGFCTVTFFSLLYLGWVCHIAYISGHWVYPVLSHLSNVGRAAFIAAMCVLQGIYFILGYFLQSLRWGHEEPHQELIYHKRK